MTIDLSRFKDTFFEEAAEHVASIERDLLHLEESDDSRALLDAIFRAAHSIKGASGVFGFTHLTDFTHVLESVLDRLREGTIACDRATVNLLLSADDVLKGVLESARSGQPTPVEMPEVLARLDALLGRPDAPPVIAIAAGVCTVRRATVRFRPSADILRQGLDPLVLLRELSELGQVESIQLTADLPEALDSFDPETCYLAWSIALATDASVSALREVFLFAEDGAELDVTVDEPVAAKGATVMTAPAAERRAGADRRQSPEGSSMRVSTEKVDRLIDLVGELVIAQSMVATLADQGTPNLAQLRDAVALLGRNTRELQERVLGIRMVPIGGIFSRFPRLVRDVAAELHKDVRLELAGQDTELDKGVVERLGDPLTHLVRNAIDHGLEQPDARVAAGKPSEGTIRLSSYTRGSSVVIEVADDGRGLDTDRIQKKAIDQGLITADQALSQDALHQLIFTAGFSTAAAVSDLSGRGVGMDVVKRDVEALKGTVAIDSRRGDGTRITITLPLTVAILDGQIVAIGDARFVLPLTVIVESLRPKRAELGVVLGQGEVVRVRGEAIPLVRLHKCLGIPARHEDPCLGIVVLVEHHGSRAALLVDELAAQHQVVIKSLDTHYEKVEGVMGVTIMGDGTVALILDVPSVMRLARLGPVGQRVDSTAAA